MSAFRLILRQLFFGAPSPTGPASRQLRGYMLMISPWLGDRTSS